MCKAFTSCRARKRSCGWRPLAHFQQNQKDASPLPRKSYLDSGPSKELCLHYSILIGIYLLLGSAAFRLSLFAYMQNCLLWTVLRHLFAAKRCLYIARLSVPRGCFPGELGRPRANHDVDPLHVLPSLMHFRHSGKPLLSLPHNRHSNSPFSKDTKTTSARVYMCLTAFGNLSRTLHL